MVKEATNLKPSKQVEQYCLTGHKNTRESTFECMGAEKQPAERSDFIIFLLSFFAYKTLDWHSLQTKAVIELLHTRATSLVS